MNDTRELRKLEPTGLPTPKDALPSRPPPAREGPRFWRWQTMPRLAGYGIALLIAWVLLTMLLPPVFTHSSERAVVDGPVSLVTTPVDGIVTTQHVQVGAPFKAGDSLMQVQNPNIDRSVLSELTSKKIENQQRYDLVKSQIDGDQARLAMTGKQLTEYQAAAQRSHADNVRALQARVATAKTQVEQQEDLVNRNQALQWAGAVSEAFTNASRYQLSMLRNAKEAASAELESAMSESRASQRKVFTSSGDTSVASMSQRRDDIASDITQLRSQMEQLASSGKEIDDMLANEQSRMDRMSNLEIKAYGPGTVQDVVAPPGTRVTAGSTLIRATDCAKADVVAVFPRSLSDVLLPGSKLKVQVDGVSQTLGASVAEVLPRATDGDQARYLVPFPPIEKNEIYLIARLDKPLVDVPNAASRANTAPQSSCAMGHWAKISIDKTWWNRLPTVTIDKPWWNRLRTVL
ncbi:multidrug transporter [Pandoraea terrae]|uniref:Multidrug transporter n=1 Tax=Pandoraea terrae TaxID=1537710 RepID=A0A5E4T4L7_9BURK|nr:multidrug transporter [Pandoraea terrae]VVD81384.1 multidrug transporter [Pandoraea terrae]